MYKKRLVTSRLSSNLCPQAMREAELIEWKYYWNGLLESHI